MKAILNGAARAFVDALGRAIEQGTTAGFDVDLTYEVLRHSMLASRVLEERRDLVMAAVPRAGVGGQLRTSGDDARND
jgi:3-hydroxyisobutyrate dehydrogenase-like beta-hydroxyacid dehydrogenase